MRLGSEDHILGMIARHFANTHASLDLARGDDCAVLRVGRVGRDTGSLCLSSDLFIEDVHFRRAYFTPHEIGHKALAVNISDIAAMGAQACAFTLCLALPPDTDALWLDALFEGMSALARTHDIALAGGDISQARQCVFSITIWGRPEQNTFLQRGTAMPGDTLFVIGELGLARVGLAVLEAYGRDALCAWPAACAAHLTPVPQAAAGRALARLAMAPQRPPALIDLSDGLARDLPRLLASWGADIFLPHDALPQEVRRYAAQHGRDPVALALNGGEEYALLGACSPTLMPALHTALPQAHSIGTVTDRVQIYCNNALMTETGFDHFA